MLRRLLVVVGAVTALTCVVSSGAYASSDGYKLSRVRHATAKFRSLPAAEKAGYGLLVDAQGVACIDMPGKGAMGVHYVNGTLVGDAEVDALHPEAVVYEPGPGNRMRLVAVEYVVFQAAWDAQHRSRPALFGRRFDVTASPNRYGLPAFYSLHAWVWKANPAGTFAMWNPRVDCPGGHGSHHHT